MRRPHEAEDQAEIAECDDAARGKSAEQLAGERHDDQKYDCAAGKRQAGQRRRVPEVGLEQLRLQKRLGVEDASDCEHEQGAQGKVLYLNN